MECYTLHTSNQYQASENSMRHSLSVVQLLQGPTDLLLFSEDPSFGEVVWSLIRPRQTSFHLLRRQQREKAASDHLINLIPIDRSTQFGSLTANPSLTFFIFPPEISLRACKHAGGQMAPRAQNENERIYAHAHKVTPSKHFLVSCICSVHNTME